MKVMFFIKSGRRCYAAAVFVLVGLVTWTGTATMNHVEGKSAAQCQKNTGYNCGAVFPLNGNTCGQSGCCCRQEDGTGYKMNTCDGATGYAYRGCNSCLGYDACFETNNVNIGDSSCHGKYSCEFLSDSTIDNDSCHVVYACDRMQNSVISDGSCQGKNTCYEVKYATIGKGSCNNNNKNNIGGDSYKGSCTYMENSTIHDSSCQGDAACLYVMNSTIQEGSCQGNSSCDSALNSIIGKGSCNGNGIGKNEKAFGYSCAGIENITIGHNSCNKGLNSSVGVCEDCAHNVPDNACNQGITADMTDEYCNFCVATQGAVSYEPVGVSSSTSKNKKSKSNKKQAVSPPKKK